MAKNKGLLSADEMRSRVSQLHSKGLTDDEIANRIGRATETAKKYRNQLGLPSLQAPKTTYSQHDKVYRESDEQAIERERMYGGQTYNGVRYE